MDIFLKENQFKNVFESHIKIETYSKTIESLFINTRSRNKINYKPYYQRNYVWDDSKASYFIESILLGTEIPPLIFFDEGGSIEVIDGRQRFETIKRFMEGGFSLSKNGLTSLIDLQRHNCESLRQIMPKIYEAFLDAKVRIIEFKLVNNPPTDPILIDKLKKEIFGRYNSGITPLKSAEIDNAIYNSDDLSKYFKSRLKRDTEFLKRISELFLRARRGEELPNIENVMQFIRKSLVIFKFPVKTYASGKSRMELISKFYEFHYSEVDDVVEIYSDFSEKVDFIYDICKHLEQRGILTTRLLFECLLWGINIAKDEGLDYGILISSENLNLMEEACRKSHKLFDLTDSHYTKETISRYTFASELFEKIFSLEMSAYLSSDKSSKDILDPISANKSTSSDELEKLESLRITKPDPSRNTIDDIIRAMKKSRFLIRPSYQRSEVINLPKSSAIIESMLLGVMLPAIFIYKRKDGVSEVIDGQQRILTILGFIGESYLDENGNTAMSKNPNFKLRSLRILTGLVGKGYEELTEDLKNRLLDFDLFVVEIEERLNPEFNPVDLFIRLNNKPYPIKENSFEMWNSWVIKDIVEKIKSVCNDYNTWFYIKNVEKERLRDRMANEELITILAYFYYKLSNGEKLESFIDIHQKGGRINIRIKGKIKITDTLREICISPEKEAIFLRSLNRVSDFIGTLREILLVGSCVNLESALDALISSGSLRKYYSRTLQDFYVLWVVISSVNLDVHNAKTVSDDLVKIFSLMKKSDGRISIEDRLSEFHNKINFYRISFLPAV